MERKMLPKFVVALALVPTVLAAGAASAHGGGGSTMPGISYTDMPAYAPKPGKPVGHACKPAHKCWGSSTSR
jgi:hypothetical protein